MKATAHYCFNHFTCSSREIEVKEKPAPKGDLNALPFMVLFDERWRRIKRIKNIAYIPNCDTFVHIQIHDDEGRAIL